jgi:hypothetical protein
MGATNFYSRVQMFLFKARAPYITKTAVERAADRVKSAGQTVATVAKKVPGLLDRAVTAVKDPAFRAQVKADVELARELLEGRAKEHYGPLVKRLAHRAMFNRDPQPETPATSVGNVVAQA